MSTFASIGLEFEHPPLSMFKSVVNIIFKLITVIVIIVLLCELHSYLTASGTHPEWSLASLKYRRYIVDMLPYDRNEIKELENEKIASDIQKDRPYKASDDDADNVLTTKTLNRLKSLLNCNNRDFLPETSKRGRFWVLKNYAPAEHGPLQCYETVTYTTHGTLNFLDNVEILVKRWMAPISLAIYAPGTDFQKAVNSIKYLRDCLSNNHIKKWVTFHIFFPEEHIPMQFIKAKFVPSDGYGIHAAEYSCSIKSPYADYNSNSYVKRRRLIYPINFARNIAKEASLTHFTLMSDIELYPTPYFTNKFLNMIAKNTYLMNASTNPMVFVLPVFEVSANVGVPSTKTELQAMLTNNSANVFHQKKCLPCHLIPQMEKWKKMKETSQLDVFYVAKRQDEFWQWEPMYIGTHQDPHHDERLSWEGMYDKMPQAYIMCVRNYDYMILDNAFLVHKPGYKKPVLDADKKKIIKQQGKLISSIRLELFRVFGIRQGCAL